MQKNAIVITGTPCVGKTTLACLLSEKLKAVYINLTEFAEQENLIARDDRKRKTRVINEAEMRRKLCNMLNKVESDRVVVIDGHYAAAVVPKSHVARVFVLRRNPIELRVFMEKNGFTGTKLWENLASEILDVCLVEALQWQEKSRVCELDITGKSVVEAVDDVLAVLENRKKCIVGCVDWLGMLETKSLLSEYLRL
ncbi:MAG: adenylate kinase family protein [Candidatus Bathyarchaeia archaeon]